MSKQDYGTPRALIDAVEQRWGKLTIDLAASVENAKAPKFLSAADDYLKQPSVVCSGLCWLNPPFADLAPWMAKCRDDAADGARIVMLVPASVGSEWFAQHVWGRAKVVAVRPRLTFEGCHDPYPKDCMLLLWGRFDEPSFSTWRWRP
jgi:phage N-6-adenine-methyltransferase